MLTKAQKENQARFKAVQAKAKELKAKSPKLTHIEAVKKAWALMPGKGIVKKTIKVKKMPIAGKLNLTGKETRLGYVPKKVAAVKKPMVSKHKDTKSHNVNIRVVSGIPIKHLNYAFKKLEELNNGLTASLNYLEHLKKMKSFKFEIDDQKKQIVLFKRLISEQKNHIKELKKHI